MTDAMTTTRKYGVRYLTFTQKTNDLMGYRQPSDTRFPAGRIRRALSDYGWRGKMWTSSIPARIVCARRNDLNPNIVRVRRGFVE